MIKVGIYASYFGKDEPKAFPDVESFIDLAYELRLDAIDFRADVGFSSRDPDYLLDIKLKCLKAGLSIGYLASGGHFVGAEEELQAKVDETKADVEMAAFLGAPMIRLFCGAPEEGGGESEIECFREVCDFAADAGIMVGLQNHPCTGDDILRILRDTHRENFTFILDTGQWVGSPGRNRGVSDPNVDIYRYMEQTAPYASYVRAKIYKIDSGREEWLDYARIVQILKSADFNGVMSITFEGEDVNRCDDRETFRLAARHLTFILDTGQWVGSPGRNRGVGDPNVDIYRYMEQTAPYASYVRAKIYKIDSGREEWLDYARIVQILKSADFNGVMSITFEGEDVNRCDDRETFRLAARHLRELIAET